MKSLYNNLFKNINIRLVSGFVIAAFVLPCCKKHWLEAKSDNKLAVPTTVADFQALLDNVTVFNWTSTPALNEIAADGHYYTESIYNSFSATNIARNAYLWTNKNPYYSVSDYYSLYNVILTSNVIIKESEKSDDPDTDGLEQVRAQALFHRGRLFFDLAQTFAPPYVVSKADVDPGIVLRTNTDITVPSKRSSNKQTYDQIIADLQAAIDILPDIPLFLTRASKPAALGMLAKVYLVMGDYENAFKYADEYIKLKNELLDYNTIPQTANYIGVNPEVAFLRFVYPTSSINSNYLIDQDLYDSYDNNDIRKTVFFKTGSAGITFKGSYCSNTQTEVFSGLGTDEIYLIRAEGYARTGKLQEAMKDLNDLLRTRWTKNPDGSTTYTDQTASDETEALRKIFAERKKQLILRGVRWSDLRRMNLDDRFKITLTRTIGGETYVLEPDSYRYTFPIPEEIIQKSGIQQNEGWRF